MFKLSLPLINDDCGIILTVCEYNVYNATTEKEIESKNINKEKFGVSITTKVKNFALLYIRFVLIYFYT